MKEKATTFSFDNSKCLKQDNYYDNSKRSKKQEFF